uniref:tRNA-splicing endonuclease subunit Sen54 N-terminal domain-containing protein n=1 Tax=Trichobilharzia regenti TaxID=157069 RepID=A0AA85KHU4_TRIRE|nr:unnamed protein product [Trichobilharzia regenti]
MDHFLVGKALSARSDSHCGTKLEKCKRKRLFEPVSLHELENAYTQYLSSLSQEFARAPARLSSGVIDGDFIRLSKICGKYFRIMGFSFNGSSYLYPEEALLLIESNKIQVYDGDLPLSVQQLYDQLLSGETYLHYLVYSRLSRLNFSLRRRVKCNALTVYRNLKDRLFKIPQSINILSTTEQLCDTVVSKTKQPEGFQSLVDRNEIHSIADLMTCLQKIVLSENADSNQSKRGLNLLYDVYGNNHAEKERIINFSKRSPAHPDYVLSVVSPQQVYPCVEADSLIKAGLMPDTSVIVAMVDGCDISFYMSSHFEIPNLNFVLTH